MSAEMLVLVGIVVFALALGIAGWIQLSVDEERRLREDHEARRLTQPWD
jgi:hypothetical protein